MKRAAGAAILEKCTNQSSTFAYPQVAETELIKMYTSYFS